MTNITTKIITAYEPKFKTGISFKKVSLTKQSHKKECDINQIMSRYQKTGVLEFANQHQPQYGDVTGMDFDESMQIVARGKSMFAELPSKLRSKFENDPAKFLDFVHDPKNDAEMVEMGLKRPPEPSTPVVEAPPTTSADKAPTAP